MARPKTTTSKSHRRKTSGTKMRSTNLGMSNNRLSIEQRGYNMNDVKVSDLEQPTRPQGPDAKFAFRRQSSESPSIDKVTKPVRGMKTRLQIRQAKEARRQARDANESHAQKHQRMLRYIFGEKGVDSIEDAWRTGNKAALFDDFNTRDDAGKDPTLKTENTFPAVEDDPTQFEPPTETADGPKSNNHDHAAEASNRSGSDKAASRPVNSPVQEAQFEYSEVRRQAASSEPLARTDSLPQKDGSKEAKTVNASKSNRKTKPRAISAKGLAVSKPTEIIKAATRRTGKHAKASELRSMAILETVTTKPSETIKIAKTPRPGKAVEIVKATKAGKATQTKTKTKTTPVVTTANLQAPSDAPILGEHYVVGISRTAGVSLPLNKAYTRVEWVAHPGTVNWNNKASVTKLNRWRQQKLRRRHAKLGIERDGRSQRIR